jgi:hypothetical protein
MLKQPSASIPHPETEILTPLWTGRQVAEAAKLTSHQMKMITKLLPPSEYGTLRGSPLWSLRQVALVLGWVKWLRIWTECGDKFAGDQLKARTAMCWKEWKDGNRKRLGNGNHRNARWSVDKQLRACRQRS